MIVAAAAIGSTRTEALAASPELLAMVLRGLNHPNAAKFIGLAAIVALPTVIMAFYVRPITHLLRDGPRWFVASATQRGEREVRHAGVDDDDHGCDRRDNRRFLPLQRIAEVANAGTLVAFIAVAVCMLVLRIRRPMHRDRFAPPAATFIAWAAIVGCAYLFVSLPGMTKLTFVIWNAIGILVYFALLPGSRARWRGLRDSLVRQALDLTVGAPAGESIAVGYIASLRSSTY